MEKYKSLHPESPVELDVRMIPYQLNPALTETPISRHQYGTQKFGEERWKMISQRLLQQYNAAGIEGYVFSLTLLLLLPISNIISLRFCPKSSIVHRFTERLGHHI